MEKYGGSINRYNDKIIYFIKQRKTKPKEQPFIKINDCLNSFDKRLTLVEKQLENLVDINNQKLGLETKNLNSYLNYFKTDERQELAKLINEILNHRP